MQAKSTAFKWAYNRSTICAYEDDQDDQVSANICFHKSVYSRLYESLSLSSLAFLALSKLSDGKLYLIRSTLAPSFVSFVRFRGHNGCTTLFLSQLTRTYIAKK